MSESLFDESNAVSWVQVFGGNEASVKYVTPGSLCPSISINGIRTLMNMRAEMVDADNNQYSICEKFITAGDKKIIIEGRLLPSIPEEINDFIVIGDTGSNLDFFCDNMPLDHILAFNNQIIEQSPDVILHIGDLVYGNKCYKGNKQIKHFSAIINEFLLPSKDLLSWCLL